MYNFIKSLFISDKILNKNLIIFLFCIAIIFGPAYTLFDTYDYDMIANPDVESYIGLANFDFNQSPIRKFRVIIPFIASGVNFIFNPAFNALKPYTFPGPDFSLCLSFLLVNCFFMAIFGLVIFRLCKEFCNSNFAILIGLISVLTCRWTSYFIGIPSTDSLYLIILAITLLGLKTNNKKLLIIAIFIGPWTKESFIFIAPLIYFYSNINKFKQLLLFFISGIIIFSFRYYIDSLGNYNTTLGLEYDFAHFEKIPSSLIRLFSFHGIYEVFSIVGFWGLLFLLLIYPNIRIVIKNKTTLYMKLFLIIVLIHALLSNELARMFYLATPIIAVWLSIISEEFMKYCKLNNLFNFNIN